MSQPIISKRLEKMGWLEGAYSGAGSPGTSSTARGSMVLDLIHAHLPPLSSGAGGRNVTWLAIVLTCHGDLLTPKKLTNRPIGPRLNLWTREN